MKTETTLIKPKQAHHNFKYNVFEKLGMYLVAIVMIFIYVPLRFLWRKLCKFILWIAKLFAKKGEATKDFNQKGGFLKFISESSSFHPYHGDNKYVHYFEHYVTGEKVEAQKNRAFVFFLLPSLASFIVFVISPFIMGVYYSFTDWTGLNAGEEVYQGFKNYAEIFGDYKFIYSFIRTALYSILNIIVINVVAFSLAMLVTKKLKLKNIYRAGFFIPNLIGGLILGYIWQFIYSDVLPSIGASMGWTTGIFEHSLIGGYASGGEAMAALIGVVTWQYAGYIMMIYIAAIQNVPVDLIEASKIDGATSMQRLRHIVFPLVAQAFTIALFLTLVTSFKQFDTVVSLTGGGPPGLIPDYLANVFNVSTYSSVETLDLMAINIYSTAFVDYSMGVGQAKAIIFFLILLIVSLAQVTYNQRKEVEL